MYNLLNKILSRFNLKLVSTKPVDLVKETVKFLDRLSPDLRNDSLYVGDITFVTDKTGKTYLRKVVGTETQTLTNKTLKFYLRKVVRTEHKYFDYDGDTYTPEQLQEKLNND